MSFLEAGDFGGSASQMKQHPLTPAAPIDFSLYFKKKEPDYTQEELRAEIMKNQQENFRKKYIWTRDTMLVRADKNLQKVRDKQVTDIAERGYLNPERINMKNFKRMFHDKLESEEMRMRIFKTITQDPNMIQMLDMENSDGIDLEKAFRESKWNLLRQTNKMSAMDIISVFSGVTNNAMGPGAQLVARLQLCSSVGVGAFDNNIFRQFLLDEEAMRKEIGSLLDNKLNFE